MYSISIKSFDLLNSALLPFFSLKPISGNYRGRNEPRSTKDNILEVVDPFYLIF